MSTCCVLYQPVVLLFGVTNSSVTRHISRFDPSQENLQVEEGVKPEVIQRLRDMGHNVTEVLSGPRRSILGRGQVITRGAWWDISFGGAVCKDSSVYWAGSDPRADGIVACY